jgi:NAD dependent epimerase/dehydratase family enzyme
MGEMAVILLTGSRISSEKIKMAGFHFRFPSLDIALKDIFAHDNNNALR